MIALVVILAAALGAAVTLIVILLFLRSRSIRPMVDADRQITEARVELFRDLQRLTDPPDTITRAGGDPPDEPVAVNGHTPAPAHPKPVRTKKHLGLHQGGAVALVLGLAGFVREATAEHRGRLIGALVGAGVTVTSVTTLTITPWESDTNHEPPSSAPTAASTIPDVPGFTPPPAPQPTPAPALGGTPPPPGESPSPSAPGPEPSPSASVSPSHSQPVGPPSGTPAIPVDDDAPAPSPGGTSSTDAPPGDESPPPGSDRGGEGPTGEPSPSDPAPTPEPTAPTAPALCLDADVPPLLDVDACLPTPRRLAHAASARRAPSPGRSSLRPACVRAGRAGR